MGRGFRFQWLFGLLMIALLAAAGVYVYDLGVARGLAENAQVVGAPAGTVPVVAWWPRPWGFGFGFFPFFPLLFILFWFVVLRGFFWRRAWYGGACGYGRVPSAFDD